MTTVFAPLLFLIFLFLSSIHFYWSFGGKWGKGVAVPTTADNIDVMHPGFLATFIVASVLLGFGMLILIKSGFLYFKLPNWLSVYGLWVVAAIFLLRSIGDFNYVGFFKKIKNTKFGQNDTKYYSPLCLMIAILTILINIS